MKYNFLFVIVFVLYFLLPQTGGYAQDSYYYYKSQPVEIPLNCNRYWVYFDKNTYPKDSILRHFSVSGDILETEFSEYACIINYICEDRKSGVSELWKKQGVVGVEYIVDNGNISVPITNLFSVRLKKMEDTARLKYYAVSLGAKVLPIDTMCRNWVTLRNTNRGGTSLETANRLWEVGLWEDIDYGFNLTFSLNDVGCVSDLSFGSQWNMDAINACGAWNITTGDTSVRVAVVDDGVYEAHEELSGCNIAYSYDADGGCVPAVTRWNGSSQNHYLAHGAHIGGIIFAGHNNYEVAGVAPNSSLINISRTWNTMNADCNRHLTRGINAAVDHGANIMNNSWGDYAGYFLTLHAAMVESALDNAIEQGVLLICSAGNCGENYGGIIDFPASYREEIIAVGSVDSSLNRSSFSSYGPELDIMAPGENILSTTYYTPSYDHYYSANGTSQATAHVSGVAALMLSVNPNLTSSQISRLIKGTAQKTGNYTYEFNNTSHLNGSWNQEMGHGLIDAEAAVSAAARETRNVYISDDTDDSGFEPNQTQNSVKNSPDIWITDLNGNTVYVLEQGVSYKIKVRLHNKKNTPCLIMGSSLAIHWTVNSGPLEWSSSFTSSCSTCDCAKSGTISGPSAFYYIPANGNLVISINWTAPNYINASTVCPDAMSVKSLNLIANFNDGGLTIGVDETNCPLEHFVRANNNVAWKSYSLYWQILPMIVSISPNPANGQATIVIETSEEYENMQIEILRIDGYEVYRSNLSTYGMTNSDTRAINVDLSQMPAGQYMVRLKANGTVLDAKRLILNQ